MGKKIINIVKYILFLGIGVVLFYLATLEITQGPLIIEGESAQFEVGSGLDQNSEGWSKLLIPAVTDELNGLKFSISNNGEQIHSGTLSSNKELENTFYVPAGENTLSMIDDKGEAEFVIKGVDRTKELVRDMKSASVPGIALSFLFGYLAIVSRGMRWLIILEPMGYKPNTWRSIHSVAFGYFANTFVPRSGELARCAALNQTDDVPVDKLFGTVISERVVDMLMLIVFLSVAVLTNLSAFERLLGDMTGNDASDEGGLGLAFWLLITAIVLGVLAIIFRKKLIQTKIFMKIKGFVTGVMEGLSSVLKMKRKGAFISHTIFIWVMYFLMAFVIYKSIDATSHMSVFEALFVMVAGGFGMILPAPGGIGAYHWSVKLGFIAIGLSGTLGFAVANVLWLTQTIMIVLAGGIGYLLLMYFRIKRDRKAEQNA
ncbi:MAG: lysylphosphatidylglycerol synthase transmembrane domain-containing protein [Flavobacteriales bacterium]